MKDRLGLLVHLVRRGLLIRQDRLGLLDLLDHWADQERQLHHRLRYQNFLDHQGRPDRLDHWDLLGHWDRQAYRADLD